MTRYDISCHSRRTFLGALGATSLGPGLAVGTANERHSNNHGPRPELVTLDHLERLHDTVETPDGETLHFWWIYAEPQDSYDQQPPASATYEMVWAGNEGVACVDDVARAAVVYLRHHERFGDDHALTRAKQALEFVEYMQLDSGQFLNFITIPERNAEIFGSSNPDVVEGIRVNGTNSSYPSLGWWAARAAWAFGVGYRVFRDEDPAFASRLETSLQSLMDAWSSGPLEEYAEYETKHGMRAPAWVLANGTDATAPAVLGLASYAELTGSDQALTQLRKFAEGIAAFQFGDEDAYPFAAHLPWTGSRAMWHAWGARQTAALARAGDVLEDPAFVDSARQEVTGLFTHLLASYTQLKGFYPAPERSGQISYGANALAQGCIDLWQATGESWLATLGGLFGSWYFGNNIGDVQMYDPTTGRGFDGLYTDGVNWNAGAESTICALLSMLDLATHPHPADALETSTFETDPFTTVEAESGETNGAASVESGGWTGEALVSDGAYVALDDGGRVALSPTLDSGAYRPYVVLRRTSLPETGTLGVASDGDRVELGVGEANSTYLWMEGFDALPLSEDPTVEVDYDGPANTTVDVDAVVFQPLVEHRVAAGTHEEDTRSAIARSFASTPQRETIRLDTDSKSKVRVRRFDADGNRVGSWTRTARNGVGSIDVRVEPLGSTLVDVDSLGR